MTENPLTAIKLFVITVETAKTRTMHIFDKDSRERVMKAARHSLAHGATVTWEDKSEQWIEPAPLFHGSTFSSYWHEDGNRIRTEIVEYTRKDGEHTTRVLRTIWMDYDKAMGF